jgi:hypothetical protein
MLHVPTPQATARMPTRAMDGISPSGSCVEVTPMKKRNEENVKAIIHLLQRVMTEGTLEPGQAEALKKSLAELCRARRANDPAKLWAAVDHVARVFLRKGIRWNPTETDES